MPRSPATIGPSLVIAVEGFDAAGSDRAAESVGRWLERKGLPVRFHASEPSPLVRAAARSARTRRALTPRVAALLAAADLTARSRAIVRSLQPGSALVLDRYAWTAAARDAARGLDLRWTGALYAACPRPDVVVLLDMPPVAAAREACALRGADPDGPTADAFAAFLTQMAEGYRVLAAGSSTVAVGPWATSTAVVAASAGPDAVLAAVRERLGGRIDVRTITRSRHPVVGTGAMGW